MENKSGYILSICIPTYNRARFLVNSLESLYRQMDDALYRQVEVMVSNNCSTDNTDAVVNEYIHKGMPITYFKNESNLGPDCNFLQCIHQAKGKYVLLLGDDDLLLKGSVSTLADILQDDYGVVYISGRPYAERDAMGPDIASVNLVGQTYTDINHFLMREHIFITFMSGNIFNKTILPEFDEDIYRRSNLLQVPFFLHAACRAEKNLFLTEKFLATGGNGDNNGGYGLFTVFGVNLFNILYSFKKYGITDETIRYIADFVLLKFLPTFILLSRKKGNFSTESITVLEKYHRNNWRYRYIDYPLSTMPLTMAEACFFIYRCIRKLLKLMHIWKE